MGGAGSRPRSQGGCIRRRLPLMCCNRPPASAGRATSLIRGIRGRPRVAIRSTRRGDSAPSSELYSTPPPEPAGMRMQPWNPVWIKHRGPLHELTLCGSGPIPCSARQPRLRDQFELGEGGLRALDGCVRRHGRAPQALPGRHRGRHRRPPAQPQPGQRSGQAGADPWLVAAYGWGWLVDLLEELELEPHLVHPSRSQGDRLGQAAGTTSSTQPPWPNCSAATCCPRPGSHPRRPGTCGRCCATGPASSAWQPR
jgi:hypothetical protein